jgi:DNA-directed RNA polymerase specialized sigma24 family protein
MDDDGEFERFVRQVEPELRRALTGHLAPGVVADAVAEAFAYAWQHRERVLSMTNPAGYL